MRTLLAERNFPISEIRFFASARSAGKLIEWNGREVVVEDADRADPAGLDVECMAHGPRCATRG